MNTYIKIKLDKRVDYYHSNREIYEIFEKVTKLPGVAIELTKETTPTKENDYTKYTYTFDLDYYQFVQRGLI